MLTEMNQSPPKREAIIQTNPEKISKKSIGHENPRNEHGHCNQVIQYMDIYKSKTPKKKKESMQH